jgi:Phage gp6-like head-tail connector protein
MSSINSLTSLARARAWAGVTTTNDDPLLTSLISEVSRFILSYLGRPTLFDNQYAEVMDGSGRPSVLLRHWPVTRVTQLQVDGITISEALSSASSGFVLEMWDGMPVGVQQRLSLRGYKFSCGMGNVTLAYDAGYKMVNEAHVISAGGADVTVAAPYGSFGADSAVTYADGTPLMAVTSAPAHGQYTVNAGLYGFAAVDAGMSVLISYSYIPSDIEHACVALVGERYRYRSRIGEISKSLGGQETMSYSQKDMPEFVRTLLQPYRRVLPA